MPDQVSFAKGSTKPTSGITTGRLYVVDSSTTDKSDLYLGKDATHLIQIGATVAQGAKADTSVQSVKVGSTSYSPSSGVVSLPAYPTTLPASDVYAWAKAATKPSYNLDEVPDGTNRKLSRYVPYNGVLMPTNPFGGKMLYINSIDNAFASAPKRYYVTGTVHLKTVNGVNYPYEDTSKAITDDNYWVDSPVVSTLTSAQCQSLFDGSYEGGYTIPVGHYLKLRIMFGTNTSPSASTSYFPGYPYGSYYLSYYYAGVPSSAEAHIYNKYAAHTVGWHKYQATYFAGSSESGSSVIQQISDGGDYQRTCVDFIIKSPDSGTATTITEVDYQLSRPALSRDGSTVTKFGNQVLYHSFLWNNGTENGGTNTIQIDPNGTISAISFTENGTSLSNKYLALTGGTLNLAQSASLVLRRTAASGGSFITYYNNNQYSNFWRSGMDLNGNYLFHYNGADLASIDTAGNIRENGTALSSKYLGISAKAADSSKLNGQGASYYLNYNNLTNKPTIPTTYVSTVNGASGAITNVAKTNTVNTWTSTQGIKTTSVPALELKNTSSSGGAFIDYENNNQTTNYWRSGMASSGTFAFLYNGTSKVEISTSGGITANGDVVLYTASGDSPRLTFQRGTLTDTYNDWSIYDSGGLLYIQQRGSGSTAWETRATFTQSTVNFAGSILEGGTALSSKYVQLANLNSAIDSRLTSKYQIEENNGALQLSTSKTVNVEGDTVSITSDGTSGISLYDANSSNELDINSNGIDLIADYKFDVSAAGGSVYVRTIDGTNLDISAIGTISLTGAVAIGGTGQNNSALYYDAGYLGLCNDKIHLDYATGNYYTDSAINIAIPNLYKMYNQNTMQYSNPYISTDDQATVTEMAEILAVLS